MKNEDFVILTNEEVERLWEITKANFEWGKVARAMGATGWTYWDTEPYTPSIDDLQDIAKSLFYDVANPESLRTAYNIPADNPTGLDSSAGGFLATRLPKGIRLEFVFAECEAGKEDL